jgi:3-methyl-2-oxobutanoate hydroxymethyltransferase
MKPVTTTTLRDMKQKGEKIACLTAYDYSFAVQFDRAGVDLIMVGDSLGMVVQGHESTLPVSLAEIVYHASCVARGVARALFVVDLPFMTYQTSREQALTSAGRLMRKGGAHVVKLEGGEVMAATVQFLVERGIPVCGHVGLTPQSVHQLGGFRVQGRDEGAERVRRDALALEQAGASLIVLEAVPAELAAQITQELTIPTIGIGAGVDCDGQILVSYDMLGIYPRQRPKFARDFLQGAGSIEAAAKAYVAAVKSKSFPGPEHSFHAK